MDNEVFGDYLLQELIGRGGMGEVYRAYDTVRKRIVAVKRLPATLAADEQFRTRFRTESEVAARLTEAHVLPIHDFGEIDGRLFLDMRYVQGADVGALLRRRGPLAPATAVDVVAQVAAALDAAHADGLVHRDVKPSNVLVTLRDVDETPDFAYLTDFGVAQVGGADTGLSTTNAAAGTVDYMAPERFTSRRVDHRVDVYSLGCLLHEMVTGDKPFPADSMPEAMHAHIYTEPPRASEAHPSVPAALDDVIHRAMAKDPAERYASCGLLAADARAAAGPRAAAASSGRGGGAATASGTASGTRGSALSVAPGRTVAADESPTSPNAGAWQRPRPLSRRVMIGSAAGIAAAILAVVLLVPWSTRSTAAPGGNATVASSVPASPASASPGPPAAPPAPAAPPVADGLFTGRTSDNSVTIALATRGDKVAAYICDGRKTEAWLEGTVVGDVVTLSSPKGATLTANRSTGAVLGRIDLPNRQLSFSADRSGPPAGLYEARAGSTRIGWIVMPDGSRVGLATDQNGTQTPPPPLDDVTKTTTVNGQTVPAPPVVPGGWGG